MKILPIKSGSSKKKNPAQSELWSSSLRESRDDHYIVTDLLVLNLFKPLTKLNSSFNKFPL